MVNSRLEHDQLHGSDNRLQHQTGGRQDGSSARPATSHAELHLVLRPRGRLCGGHELRRLIGPVRFVDVRQKRLQTHF